MSQIAKGTGLGFPFDYVVSPLLGIYIERGNNCSLSLEPDGCLVQFALHFAPQSIHSTGLASFGRVVFPNNLGLRRIVVAEDVVSWRPPLCLFRTGEQKPVYACAGIGVICTKQGPREDATSVGSSDDRDCAEREPWFRVYFCAVYAWDRAVLVDTCVKHLRIVALTSYGGG